MSLYEDHARASADVKMLAQDHIRRIEEKVAKLLSMRDTLNDLVTHCHGDSRPDCPILDDLAGGASASGR